MVTVIFLHEYIGVFSDRYIEISPINRESRRAMKLAAQKPPITTSKIGEFPEDISIAICPETYYIKRLIHTKTISKKIKATNKTF